MLAAGAQQTGITDRPALGVLPMRARPHTLTLAIRAMRYGGITRRSPVLVGVLLAGLVAGVSQATAAVIQVTTTTYETTPGDGM